MSRLLRRAFALTALTSLAAIAPPPADALPTQGVCGTWCVSGYECSIATIRYLCSQACTEDQGVCGDNGQCPSGSFYLSCTGDPI